MYAPTVIAAPSWGSQPAARPVPQLAPALAGQPQAPRPLVRAKGEDLAPAKAAPSPRQLTMPSPNQMGVASTWTAPAGGTDWNDARRRLDRLGAVYFHVEKLDRGGFRFTCLLPTAQAGRTHRVEAVAATEAEAVRLALARAEEGTGDR